MVVACLIWQISWLTTSGFDLERPIRSGDLTVVGVFFSLSLPAWSGWIVAPFLAARTRVPWILLVIGGASLLATLVMTIISLQSGSHGLGRETDIRWNGLLWLVITWIIVMPTGVGAAFVAFAFGRAFKAREAS